MNNKTLAIIFGLILLFIVIFFIGKSYGKNESPNEIPDQSDLNPDGYGKTNNSGQTSKTTFDPTFYTDDLWNSIDGVNVLGLRRSEPYINFYGLSSTNFAKVLNDWDKRYYSKNHETLYTALRNENFGYGDSVAEELKQNIRKRIIELDKLRKSGKL